MSGKSKVVWELNFSMNSDWLIKGESLQKITDAAPLLDALNRPFIPASTIKGQLRFHVKRLISLFPNYSSYEEKLFGDKGNKQGVLYFKDALIPANYNYTLTNTRYRISIDRKNRVVNDQALIMEETASLNIPLTSSITMFVNDNEIYETIALLTLAILQISSIGSGKSIGRGECSFVYDGQKEKTNNANEQLFSYVKVKVDNQPLTFEEFNEIVELAIGGELG